MSLYKVIQHKSVGRPTYLDVLPSNVLQHCIMPFLDWEERIHVNMLTPAGDRTLPKKIPKERIIANQLSVSIKKLTPIAEDIAILYQTRESFRARGKRGGPSQLRIVEKLVRFLDILLEPHNILLVQYSMTFRNAISQKIVEFSDPNNIVKIPRIYLREQMADVIQKLIHMLESNPFIEQIAPKRFLSAPVTQNETAVLNEWWVPGVGVVRRYRGTIYTEMEE
jgi:hypothetical protein